MKDKFQEQKDILTSLKHEISLLHQQIDYLLRQGRALGLLDLDVMMNRTHTIYDQLCSINLGDADADDPAAAVTPELLDALFGSTDAPREEALQPKEEPMEEAEPEKVAFDFNLTAEDPEVVEPKPEPQPEEPQFQSEEPKPQLEEPEPLPQEPEPQSEEPGGFEDAEFPEVSLFPEEEDDFTEDDEEPEPDREPALVPELEEPEWEPEPMAPQAVDASPQEEPEREEIAFDFNLTAEDPEVVETESEREPEPQPEEPEPEPVTPEPEPAPAETDYGFIFRMEPIETPEEAEEAAPLNLNETPQTAPDEATPSVPSEAALEKPVEASPVEPIDTPHFETANPAQTYTTGDQIELEIPHFDFPEPLDDASDADSMEEPEPDSMEEPESYPEPLEPQPEEEPERKEIAPDSSNAPFYPEEHPYPEEPESIVEPEPFPYEPVVFGSMEDKDDLGFEFDTHDTHEAHEPLGEKLHVQNLKNAIGINDKFLLVNELFGGSMEKYNRSIENLDDLPTLNGALIYMNELRIELQWNSNNEAYKKLLELVHRKFED